jgi:tungstate transport system substrate-binding protein
MARARNVRLRLIHAAIAIAFIGVVSTACRRPSEPLVLATTTSVGNSGLLDVVLPAYRGRTVRSLLVGSGRALEMLAAGQADAVISHAPARETAILESRPGLWYRKILYNDFLIVGPATDPAGITRASNAVEAMKRIAEAPVRFLSRGDESGTHERERELWALAGVTPGEDRLVIAGAGMGQTLRIASSTNAYTLTDRGTFEALRNSLELDILNSGDPRLLNTYAVLAALDNTDGLAFARWLAEGEGRTQIQNALATGKIRGFSVWPDGSPAGHPGAQPR